MRKWLAIIGFVLTLLIAGVYVVSVRYYLLLRNNRDAFPVVIGAGRLKWTVGESLAGGEITSGARWELMPNVLNSMDWGFDSESCWVFSSTQGKWVKGSTIYIPLWAPPLLTAISTYFLWPRPFRRPRPGHCRACGYDLAGAPSSTCPECGKGAA